MSRAAAMSGGYPPPESVVGQVRSAGAGWSAPLLVPEDHPFFFDHALDHVSGMLTICGMLDVVTDRVGDPLECGDRRLLADLAFPAICDLDRPAEITVTPDSERDGGFLVLADQDGVHTCEGSVRLVDGIIARDGDHGPAGNIEVCPADLVHRHRIENVMLGAPVEDETGITAPLLLPPDGHYLDGFGRGRYSVRGLIEASRQFFTVLVHRAADKPMGTTIIWMRLGADLPCSPTVDSALSLRWQRVPHKGSRVKVAFDLVLDSTDTALGSFEYHGVAVSSAAYKRFRAQTRRAS